jgi:hypothetical protein
MNIIILEGHSHRGKTSTLKMVFGVLFTNGATLQSVNPLPYTSNKDFEASFVYKGKKVAIYTKGDIQRDCNNAIINANTQLVDTLILAHSSTHQLLIIDKTLHTEHIVNKTLSSGTLTEVQANATDCQTIIGFI